MEEEWIEVFGPSDVTVGDIVKWKGYSLGNRGQVTQSAIDYGREKDYGEDSIWAVWRDDEDIGYVTPTPFVKVFKLQAAENYVPTQEGDRDTDI